jgi:hypothetical protein
MPRWPHWYTVRSWTPAHEREFLEFVTLIRELGVQKPWPPTLIPVRRRNTYLERDGWEYWTMGAPVEETINRCKPGWDRPPGEPDPADETGPEVSRPQRLTRRSVARLRISAIGQG